MKVFFAVLVVLGFIASAIGEIVSIIIALVHLAHANSGYPHIVFVGLLHVFICAASAIVFGIIATLIVASDS